MSFNDVPAGIAEEIEIEDIENDDRFVVYYTSTEYYDPEYWVSVDFHSEKEANSFIKHKANLTRAKMFKFSLPNIKLTGKLKNEE